MNTDAMRELFEAAVRLEARGFFAPSRCADPGTSTDMRSMQQALDRTRAEADAEPDEPYAWFWQDGSEAGVLALRQDYEEHRQRYPRMTFTPVYTRPAGGKRLNYVSGWNDAFAAVKRHIETISAGRPGELL